MPYDKERQYYRIQFPPGDLAEFIIGPLTMHIHEASERGIRYEPRDGHRQEEGDVGEGQVICRRVGQFEVTGRMSRWQGNTVVVILEPPGLPYSALMQEQLYLRKRYPTREG
jgi:hypothetical protein